MSGICTVEFLKSLDPDISTVLIVDCEGAEDLLFDSSVARHLESFLVVIELHERMAWGSSDRLREAFSATHDVAMVASVDDLQKLRRYVYPELSAFPLDRQFRYLAEYRGGLQEWLVARPHTQSSSFAKSAESVPRVVEVGMVPSY